jgi:hypothetical protein
MTHPYILETLVREQQKMRLAEAEAHRRARKQCHLACFRQAFDLGFL